MRMRKKYAVAKPRSVDEHRRKPIAQGCRVNDIAGFHRPFDAAGIGKRAHRKGWRQPGHQPVQRRCLAFLHCIMTADRLRRSLLDCARSRHRAPPRLGRHLTCGHQGDDRCHHGRAMIDHAPHGDAHRFPARAHGRRQHRRRLRDRTALRSRSRAPLTPSPSPR